MSDISDPSIMELFATSGSQQLLFDSSNSQQFYLYTTSTKQLVLVTSASAKSFYDTASNQIAGTTAWGYTPAEGMKLNNSN